MVALGESPQPLYLRVYRLIADEIASGSLGPGDRLPSERDLTERLGVSRATVRRALGELAEDGLVEASAGPRLVRRHRPAGRAAERAAVVHRARQPRTACGRRRGCFASRAAATIEEAERSVSHRAPIWWSWNACGCLDEVPVAVDATRFPLARVPGCADDRLRVGVAVRRARGESGFPPVRAAYTVEALPAPEREGALLGIGGASPCSSRKRQRTIPATGSSSWPGRTTGPTGTASAPRSSAVGKRRRRNGYEERDDGGAARAAGRARGGRLWRYAGSDDDATTAAAPAASDTTAAPAASTAAAEPTVQMDGFESLGPVELNVWSYDNQDPGLRTSSSS